MHRTYHVILMEGYHVILMEGFQIADDVGRYAGYLEPDANFMPCHTSSIENIKSRKGRMNIDVRLSVNGF